MHGIFGRGGNWRSFARKLCEQKPSLGLLLCDLRMHGKSMSASPPHTLEACARDMLSLLDQQEAEGKKISTVLGHSFGGKVALEMRRQRPSLQELWLIDSSPSKRPGAMEDQSNTVVGVLRLLEELPAQFSDRAAFISLAVNKGFDKGLAMWLAMNLEAVGNSYRMTLQAAAMKELLSDYFKKDLWGAMEQGGEMIHMVCASRDSALGEEEIRRLHKLAEHMPVQVHSVDGGHWLHVDALEELVRVLAAHLV